MALTPHPLEPTGDEMRLLVEAAMARVVPHLESLPDQPSADVAGAIDLARAISGPMPEAGRPFEEILDLLFERAIPKTFNTAGPGYLAYIPGGGLFAAALADLIADTANRYTGVFAAAPALAQLEADALAWLASIAGFPKAARGFFTSGGSLANWSALVVARRERLPENFLSGTIYASDQVHHSMVKAALLAGFPPDRVREIPTDPLYRMRPDIVAERIAADRAVGLTPFLLVGSAGTTNTGAVDPLADLADLAERERLWLHVDGAYGACFLLTHYGKTALRGIERADSLAIDPHKGLFLPYGLGALLVRDGEALRRAHAVGAAYMPNLQSDPDLVDFCEISPELSKPFRGLRLWLALQLHGVQAFRAALEEKLALTRYATEELRAIPDIEILAEPQLSVVAFRHRPPGVEGEALNAWNRTLLERINARGRVYLSGTDLHGTFAIRICVLSFRTHRDRIEAGLNDLRTAMDEALTASRG